MNFSAHIYPCKYKLEYTLSLKSYIFISKVIYHAAYTGLLHHLFPVFIGFSFSFFFSRICLESQREQIKEYVQKSSGLTWVSQSRSIFRQFQLLTIVFRMIILELPSTRINFAEFDSSIFDNVSQMMHNFIISFLSYVINNIRNRKK